MNLRLQKKHLLSLLPNNLVTTSGPAAGGTRYLTFDDGPDPAHTPRLLDLLAHHGAKASFFMVGESAERSSNIVRRVVDEGHALGNHSWDHPFFDKLDFAAQIEQIDRCDATLRRFDGQPVHRFRPPRGVLPPALLWYCVRRSRNITYWNRDSFDYKKRSAEELARALDDPPPRAGDVILMHDDGGRTVDMLEMLLPRWCERGFRFAALPPLPLTRGKL